MEFGTYHPAKLFIRRCVIFMVIVVYRWNCNIWDKMKTNFKIINITTFYFLMEGYQNLFFMIMIKNLVKFCIPCFCWSMICVFGTAIFGQDLYNNSDLNCKSLSQDNLLQSFKFPSLINDTLNYFSLQISWIHEKTFL